MRGCSKTDACRYEACLGPTDSGHLRVCGLPRHFFGCFALPILIFKLVSLAQLRCLVHDLVCSLHF